MRAVTGLNDGECGLSFVPIFSFVVLFVFIVPIVLNRGILHQWLFFKFLFFSVSFFFALLFRVMFPVSSEDFEAH